MNRYNKDYDSAKDIAIGNLRKQIFDLEQREKRYKSIEDQYLQYQDHSELMLNELHNQLNNQRKEIEISNQNYNHSLITIEELNRMIENKEHLIQKVCEDNSVLQNLIDSKNSEIDNLVLIITQRTNELKQSEDERRRLIESINEMKEEIKFQMKDKCRMLEDKNKVESVIWDLESYVEELNTYINSRHEEIQNLKQSITELEQKELVKNQELTTQQSSHLQLKDILDDLSKEKAKLVSEAHYRELNSQRLVDEITELHKQLDNLNSQNKCIIVSQEKAESHNFELREDIKKLKQNVQELKCQLDNSFNIIEVLEIHIKTVNEENRRLIRELETIGLEDDAAFHGLMKRVEENKLLIASNNNISVSLSKTSLLLAQANDQ